MSDSLAPVWKNEELEVSLQKHPACKVTLDVKVASKISWDAHKEAIKEVNKGAKVAGFRQGKAPEAMILRQFPDSVEKAEHRILAQMAVAKAQQLTEIAPLSQNTRIFFDLKSHSLEGSHLTLSFETKPEIPDVDVTHLALTPVERPSVLESHIDEAIHQSLFFFAEWKEVEDRSVQEGDFVVIDLQAVGEDGALQSVFQGVRFQVNAKRMAEWMRALIQGTKKGDQLEGISYPDVDATPEEKVEFQPKKVVVTVLKVEEAQLPELTDAFAKTFGAVDLADLRVRVREMLERQVEEAADRAVREQVNRFVLANYSFDLPQSLITSEKEGRREGRSAIKEKLSQEAFEQKLLQEASDTLRLFYLAIRVLERAGIGIMRHELDAGIQHIRSQQKEWTQQDEEGARRRVFSGLVLRKAQDLLLEKAKATLVSP